MRRLLVPTLVLTVAALADWRWGTLLAPQLVRQISWAVTALVVLLAWRFRRGRVAYAVVMLAAAAEALRRVLGEVLPGETLPGEALLSTLAVLLCVNLAVLAWTSDYRVFSTAGALRGGVLLAQVGAVALLGKPFAEPARALLVTPLWPHPILAGMTVPQVGLITFALALAVILVRLIRRPAPLEAGLCGALVATFVALETPSTSYYLAVGGVILALAMVENAFALAFEDGLTGLPARRPLEETLRHLGRTYALAMVDLDHFKLFNDRHGHEIGDQVLQMVAAKLAKVRGSGEAYRYGGEEFTIVFAGKTAKEAEPHLDELCRDIAASTFTVRSPTRPKKKPKGGRGGGGGVKNLKVTVSIGIAERSERNPQPELVMKAADKALYRSKKAGRNRVTIGR
jgi:diguanylate cyclase (GGDEF)-like protein